MANVDLGVATPINKGTYSAEATYERLNIVLGSDGATYQAIQDVPAGTALSNTSYWMQLTPKAPTIGTVTDVAFDAGASVTNSGTAMAPVYDFEVPRGVTGNESIDDTAGDGDDDVVWSADKTYNEVTDLKSQLRNLNCYDLFRDFASYVSKTSYGITYTWNEDNTICTANGTATANSSSTNLYANTTTLPSQIKPGETYYFDVNTDNTELSLQIYLYYSDGTSSNFTVTKFTKYTFPSNTIGITFRIHVSNTSTCNNNKISVAILKSKTNMELTKEFPVKGVLNSSIVSSVNDITDYCVYLLSSGHGVSDFPFDVGYLITIPSEAYNNRNVLQIAVEWNNTRQHDHILYRTMNITTWREWVSFIYTKPFEDAVLNIIKYNCFNLIDYTNGSSGSSGGITYTLNSNKTWTITGTTPSDDFSYRNILVYNTQLPEFVIPGRTYTFTKSGSDSIRLQLYLYYSDGTNSSKILTQGESVTFPSNTTGFLLRFNIGKNTTIDNETVSLSALAVPVLENESTVINQEIHNDTYNNEYNISVSPTITTDTNGWLQPIDTNTQDETGKTDMTSAIMAMLTNTGYCHLAPGIYYVSGNIDMPEGSMIEGCGYKTIVRLLSSVTDGYIFKMEKFNTISNLMISGSYTDIPTTDFTSNKGTRHGIIFNSRYEEGTSETEYSTLKNIFIRNFTGCGIKCFNTSITTYRGLYASQIDIKRCQTGIFIDFHSEFHKFEQVNTRHCYIACENDGGNNMFIGCTFHAVNTGFLIDNSLNDKSNNAHGGVIGCTFCHVGSNTGTAIAIKNTANGFTFSDCQVWYCSILIEDSYGITFSNIEFGRGIPLNNESAKGATIDIKRGGTVMFTGCVFMNDITYPPTITVTNNANVKFTGCYGSHSGNAITA